MGLNRGPDFPYNTVFLAGLPQISGNDVELPLGEGGRGPGQRDANIQNKTESCVLDKSYLSMPIDIDRFVPLLTILPGTTNFSVVPKGTQTVVTALYP